MIRISWRAGLRAAFLGVVLAGALVVSGTNASVASAACEKANKRADRLSNKTIRKAIRCVVNKERGPNLKPQDQLKKAAQNHTNYMRKSRCMAHECSGEASVYERIRRTGYFNGARSYAYSEVIASARDEASPRDIVRLWMASPSHHAALMSRAYEHLGVGVKVTRRSGVYTIDLGARSG